MFRSIKRIPINLRYFHTTGIENGVSKTMCKVLGGMKKAKKKKFYDAVALPKPTTFSHGSSQKRNVESRRASVLNKLFMKYITDVMATGIHSHKLIGHSIEINKVRIAPDYKQVNVYWATKDVDNEETIEQVLTETSHGIRSELAQLKIIGVIPKLLFLKDKQYGELLKVDKLMDQLDFGEDYTPQSIASRLKTKFELNIPLEEHLKQQIVALEKDIEIVEDPLPPMTDDVFGLQHTDIMERIRRANKKSRAPHRFQSTEDFQMAINEHPVEVATDNTALKEFLIKRKALQEKTRSLIKEYRPETEYLEDEWKREQEATLNAFDVYVDEENDFIGEEDESNHK